MTTATSVTINGVDYIRADTVTPDYSDSPVKIAILQRGWVVVGYYTEDDERVTLQGARIIRKWGTTYGLGELVSGPLPSTVLDPAGTVEAHTLGVVATIAADAAGWEDHLG